MASVPAYVERGTGDAGDACDAGDAAVLLLHGVGGGGLLQRGLVARCQHDAGARASQDLGGQGAERARRARDDGDLVAHVEQRQGVLQPIAHHLPCG